MTWPIASSYNRKQISGTTSPQTAFFPFLFVSLQYSSGNKHSCMGFCLFGCCFQRKKKLKERKGNSRRAKCILGMAFTKEDFQKRCTSASLFSR